MSVCAPKLYGDGMVYQMGGNVGVRAPYAVGARIVQIGR